MWQFDGEGQPVIKCISLGHAKLKNVLEDRELEFVQAAAHGFGSHRPSAGPLTTWVASEQRQQNPYLAPEHKGADGMQQPDYAMDWFSGLNIPRISLVCLTHASTV